MWTEPVWEEVRELREFRVCVRGYDEFDVGGAAEFLEELAAVAARGGGDGEGKEVRLAVQEEVCYEELFGVDSGVEREAWEF